MSDDVRYETDRGIATITIDRPEVMNAFTHKTVQALNDTIRRARDDDGVYVIILTGAGDAFCAGADVKDMAGREHGSVEEYAGHLWPVQNVVRQLRDTGKPSIAAVNGPAIGAGCDFALACSVRFMTDDAILREGFVRVGLVPGDGGGWLLPRLIGESKAAEYLLTGRDITPDDAEDLGLVVDVVPDSMAAANEFADEILSLPATAVQHTKRLIDPEATFEDYCERAIAYQWDCMRDPEHDEAIAAFNEKREPEYDREYA